jgi:hypothetical protein
MVKISMKTTFKPSRQRLLPRRFAELPALVEQAPCAAAASRPSHQMAGKQWSFLVKG